MNTRAALALVGVAFLLVAATDPKTETEHIVKEGETLGGIAERAGVPSAVIAGANGITDPNHIRIGQKLAIPRQKTHIVKKGDTGFAIAFDYGVPFSEIATANGIEEDSVLKVGQKLIIPAVIAQPKAATPVAATPAADPTFRRPIEGAVLLGWQRRSDGTGHEGLDFAAETGDRVQAAAAGRVIYAGDEPNRFGRLVVIDHGRDWYTAYGHLSRITVARGDQVRAGERIGLAGDAGDAERPELHFEIRKDRKPVDPAPLLGIENGG